MDGTMSPADMAAVMGNEGANGCGGGMWIFALLILLAIGGGGGLFGGKTGDRGATVGDVQRSTDFAALERQNNEITEAVRQGVYDTTGAVKDANYNTLGEVRDLETAVNAGFTDMQKRCCDTQRAIDGVKYEGAINTASINQNTTAQVQKVLDAIAGNRMADMQNQINQLQLQAAMCGIPRTNPYAYGVYPYNASPCCGNYN